MIATQLEVNAISIPDPAPPSGILTIERQILIARIVVASPLTGGAPAMLLLPGEAIPSLVAMLQSLLDKFPALTTERLAQEGVAVTSEEGKILNLVPGPEGEQ